MRALTCCALLLVAACAERPVREGTLPSGEVFREYSREPYGYRRVLFASDGRVRATEELHTEENFRRIRPGMTLEELSGVIGMGYAKVATYGDGTSSRTFRYHDVGIAKLLHVTFGADGRVLRYETEWDPAVYSRDSGPRK